MFLKALNLGLGDLVNQSFIYHSTPEHTNKTLEKESRNVFGHPKNFLKSIKKVKSHKGEGSTQFLFIFFSH